MFQSLLITLATSLWVIQQFKSVFLQPTKFTGFIEPKQEESLISKLTVVPAKCPGACVLSDVYILNTWFLMLMLGLSGCQYTTWLESISTQIMVIEENLFIAGYIWFDTFPRKPPDKDELYELVSDLLEKVGIDLFMLHMGLEVVKDMIQLATQYVGLAKLFKLRTNDKSLGSVKECFSKVEDESNIINHEMNLRATWRFLQGCNVYCNAAVWTAAKRNLKHNDGINIDSDSVNFAVDMCISDTICKDRELFVGKIQRCRNVKIQGVGVNIKATGFGTIKIRVIDDNGAIHSMLIHNVLYVPEAPLNLLSPQKWARGQGTNRKAFEATFRYDTILV